MTPQIRPADTIDRLAPTRRPNQRVVMRQNWSDLTFLHWTVAPETIQTLLPPGLEVDTYEGNAFVGLVPFTMTGVRPVGFPAFSPLSDFHETNVRTYVHHQGRDPGVWFFSLDAANATAVRLARAWFKLPYHYARMRLTRAETASGPATIAYRSERLWPAPIPATCGVRCTPLGGTAPAAPGTLEHFLAERYLLYAYAGGHLYRGQVHHTPYPLQRAEIADLTESMIAAAGIHRPDTVPLAHYAKGVQVEVFGLQIVR